MSTKEIFTREFNATAPKQVDSIRIIWKQDESPDTSYLGKYSNTPEQYAIDRKARGDMQRNEYRYFNPGQTYDDVSAADRKNYIEQDYTRMQRLQAGDWCYMGCLAEATISYPTGNGSRRIERLTSGGLWGIESDSDSKYANEVESDELADLKSHLEQFGIEWPEFEPVLTAAA